MTEFKIYMKCSESQYREHLVEKMVKIGYNEILEQKIVDWQDWMWISADNRKLTVEIIMPPMLAGNSGAVFIPSFNEFVFFALADKFYSPYH